MMHLSPEQIETLDRLLANVRSELMSALAKHPTFPTPHHGYAVIKEELDELWDEVKRDDGQRPDARMEALQVAAMGIRYAFDLCECPVRVLDVSTHDQPNQTLSVARDATGMRFTRGDGIPHLPD